MAEAPTLTPLGDEFEFTAEQEQLRATVRSLCNDHRTKPPRELWQQLASLGFIGVDVPDHAGGEGGSLVDATILAEELGRNLSSGPITGTFALSTALLGDLVEDENVRGLLRKIIEGTVTTTLVLPAGLDPTKPLVRASADGSVSWHINGTARYVIDGDADVLLVVAGLDEGCGLFAVDPDGRGVEVTTKTSLDSTRVQADVFFETASAQRLGPSVDLAAPLARTLHRAVVLTAASQLGAAQYIFETALDHAKTRLQFGRPIGSFQAVKHRLADMFVELEHVRSLVYFAAWQHGTLETSDALLASVVKTAASEMFVGTAGASLQTFGGMGFTWEHHAHRYYKRAISDAILLGAIEEHRDRVAQIVLDPIGVSR